MLQRLIIFSIRLYRAGISPLLPATCRFTPSCSRYAMEAVSKHGAIRGTALAVRRLLRCHPLGGRGYDPVPAPDENGDSRVSEVERRDSDEVGRAPRTA